MKLAAWKTFEMEVALQFEEGRVGPKYTGYISFPPAAETSLP